MLRSTNLLAPAIAASALLAACGSSSSKSTASSAAKSQPAPTQSSSSSVIVKPASNAKLNATVIVNAQGMTLYHLSGEQKGKFICTSSACLRVWHPLTATAASTTAGYPGLATVKRPDGSLQVTYKGQPLYTFAQDETPGQANGQGLKDVGTWSAVVLEAGGATTTTPSGSEGSHSSGEGGGHGY